MAGEKYARVENGVVVEVFELPDVDVRVPIGYDKNGKPTFEDRKATLRDFFPAEVEFIECGDDVTHGFTYDGSEFAAPVAPEPPPVIDWQTKLKAFLASNPDVREGLEG